MTRAQKVAKAQELRAQGLTYQAIGDRLGVSGSCVTGWLNPERNKERVRKSNAKRHEYKLAWARAHRPPCPKCGKVMSHTSAHCTSCRRESDRARVMERGARLERWWHEGLSLAEIARRLGWCQASAVGVELDRFRALGFDLPYRRRTGVKNATKFPHLRRAA